MSHMDTHSSSSMLIGGVMVVLMVAGVGALVLWLVQCYDWDFLNNAPCQRVNLLHNVVIFILIAVQDMLQHMHIGCVYVDEGTRGKVYELPLSTLPLKKGDI